MKKSKAKAYQEAGVDINAGYDSVKRIKPLVQSTLREGVIGSIGGFGGLFELDLKKYTHPVLVSGTDGVGTKLKLAFEMGIDDTVGIDCVAMCVNDIICSGAEPIIFLDYIACSKNIPEKISNIVKGIADGCKQAGCALVGGETAEMPGFYQNNEYDIAGFSVGIVNQEDIIDGSAVKAGDALIGLASSGVHSNGFSLIRKLIRDNHCSLKDKSALFDGKSLGELLLKPTKIYVRAILNLIENGLTPKAVSHITGGGFYENIPRMLPENMEAVINLGSFPIPVIFNWVKEIGKLSQDDLYSTFNMGIGMILAVPEDKVKQTLKILNESSQKAYRIGVIKEGNQGVILK